MNVRKSIYFSYKRAVGSSFPQVYEDLVRQDRIGVAPDTTNRLLVQLLAHCQRSVPYYAEIMKQVGDDFEQDPASYLLRLPILTKGLIRTHIEQLKSQDLGQRKWYFNTSGGSTGEPVKLIQDRDYSDRSNALQEFYSSWAGAGAGDSIVYIWGSKRDIRKGSHGAERKKLIIKSVLRKTCLNAFS